MDNNTKYTYGDEVHIVANAPVSCSPNSDGCVVGFTLIATQEFANRWNLPLGTIVYYIEIEDGSTREVEEKYLVPFIRTT